MLWLITLYFVECASITHILTSNKLAEISNAEFTALKLRSQQIAQEREFALKQLEKDLEQLEKERAAVVSEQVSKYSKLFKNIHYERPVVIDRMLQVCFNFFVLTLALRDLLNDSVYFLIKQEECIIANLVILENREKILKYISTLKTININAEHKMNQIIFKYGANWNTVRYNFVFLNYTTSIQKSLDVDVDALYNKFRTIFNANVQKQIGLIQILIDVAIEHIQPEFLKKWRSDMDQTCIEQSRVIDDFKTELAEFERKMDQDARVVVEAWFPPLQECGIIANDQDLKNIMDEEVKRYRKTSEILAGKRSGLVLSSQASRNRDVLDKVGEFILSLLLTKMDHADRVKDAETRIVASVNDISEEAETEQKMMEKALIRELNLIRIETKEAAIIKKLNKSKEMANAIEDCMKTCYINCTNVTRSLADKVRGIEMAYKERLRAVFLVDEDLIDDGKRFLDEISAPSQSEIVTEISRTTSAITSNESNLSSHPTSANSSGRPKSALKQTPPPTSASEQKVAKPKTPSANQAPREVINLPPSVKEIAFLSKKVADWMNEQQQLLRTRAAQAEAELQAQKAKRQTKIKQNKTVTIAKGEHRQSVGAAPEPTAPPPKPKLLDDTEYVSDYSAAKYLVELGYSGDFSTTTHISDLPYQNKEDVNIIEIPAISSEILLSLRTHLEKAVLEDAECWIAVQETEVAQKITRKVERLSSQRSIGLINYEKRIMELEEISERRISNLSHLRTTHENEAKLILSKITQVRTHYATAMRKMATMTEEFTNNVYNVTCKKLREAKSTSIAAKLQLDFNSALATHTASLKACLSEASSEYEMGKIVLLKSKIQGHHSAAWHVIREMREGIDADNVSNDMEKWRSMFDPTIESIQNTTLGQVDALKIEFEAELNDLELIENTSRCFTDMRLKIKSNVAKTKSKQAEIEQKIKSIRRNLEEASVDWSSVENIYEDIEHVRVEIAELAHYLGCLFPGLTNESFTNNWKLPFENWKAAKLNFKSGVKPANTRPGSSRALRKNKVSTQSLNLGNALPENDVATFDSKEETKTPKTPEGIIAEKGNSEEAERPKSAASVKSISHATPETGRSTHKSSTESNSQNSSKPGSASSKKSSGSKMLKSSELVEIWKNEARDIVLKLGEVYYENKTEKEIRRKDQIASNRVLFMGVIYEQLNILVDFSETKRHEQTRELVKIIKEFSQQVQQLIKFVHSVVANETIESLKVAWHEETTAFVQKRSMLYKSKHEYNRQLKLRLGHPIWKDELSRLDLNAQRSYQELCTGIDAFSQDCCKRMEQISASFTENLEYATALVVGILDGLVIASEDIIMPPDVDASNKKPVQTKETKPTSAESETRTSKSSTTSLQKKQSGYQSQQQTNVSVSVSSVTYSKQTTEWKPCATELFSFESLQPQVFKPQVLESRVTNIHDELFSSRDATFAAFAKEIKRRMDLLKDQMKVERNAEEQWITQWGEYLIRVKLSH